MARSIVEDQLQQVTLRRPPRRWGALAFLAAAACAATPVAAHAQAAVTLCHATGNPAAPYLLLTVSGPELELHIEHADDIVPAPAGGCPAVAEDSDPVPAGDEIPAPSATAQPRAPRRRARARTRARQRAAAAPAAPAAASPSASAKTTPAMTGLPLTGVRSDLVFSAGIGLLLAGFGLRRLVSPALAQPGDSPAA